MTTTLFLEAFGQLAPDPNRACIMVDEEDLYSVFRSRAELMHWSTTTFPRPPYPLLWEMEEAELTTGSDASRIGFVQVGMSGNVIVPGSEAWPATATGYTSLPEHRLYTIDPVVALPVLSQCFEDALRRFGDITLSGLQVTMYNREPLTRASTRHLSGHNWFNLTPQARTEAYIALDHTLIGNHITALAARLPTTGSFAFGPVVTVPDRHRLQVSADTFFFQGLEPARLGLAVTLPEWTASAAAWALACVIDTARALVPVGRRCAVRVTRVQ